MRTGDVPSLADLDRVYFQGSTTELAMAVAALPRVYALSMKQLYEQVIADVRDGKAGTIHPELYRAYSDNLRKAVAGYADDDLKAQFEANLSRFAAYKAFHATRQLERQLADSDGVARSPEQFDRMARTVLNTFNRYQAAEYNTAVARARTAHQWQLFSQADNAMLFPNLRWLPSRSANPREQHMPFYNRVWAKNDPFWNSNQPGNLWNCKCDWEETDDPVTGDNPEGIRPARGLEGNPAKTGKIFTDECTYVKKAGKQEGQKIEEFYRYATLTPKTDKPAWRQVQSQTEAAMKQTPSMTLNGKGYYTGKLYYGDDQKEAIVSHCFTTFEIEVAKRLEEMLPKLKNGKYEPVNMQRKNYRKKQNEGVLHFTVYEFEYGLHTYELKCEAVKKNRWRNVVECPYSLKEKK